MKLFTTVQEHEKNTYIAFIVEHKHLGGGITTTRYADTDTKIPSRDEFKKHIQKQLQPRRKVQLNLDPKEIEVAQEWANKIHKDLQGN
jgi:hypothetical protein